MTDNFYDKVAKKFGGYGYKNSSERYVTKYPQGSPEKVFKEKLISLSGKEKTVLDVGCGDGKFAFGIASYFLNLTGIDNSKELLKIAQTKKEILKIKNTDFQFQDANQMSFEDQSFSLVFSRRGPTPYSEFYRLLKPSGYYLGIDIGQKDCLDIKKIFGRGQGFDNLDESWLEINTKKLTDVGFEIIFAKDFFYTEYYQSQKDLDLFLQGVPVFEDFNSKKDQDFLEKYTTLFQTKAGIALPRHRIVTIAHKK